MDIKQLTQELGQLLLLDYDEAHAYEEAVENSAANDIKDQFTLFRNDHQRHVFVLSKLIQELGQQPPGVVMDFTKYMTMDITSPRNSANVKELFTIMQQNENRLIRKYSRVLENDLPQNVYGVVRKNFEDEEKHTGYIRSTLELSPVVR